jgi:capsular polysaccharide biosynthesis protein
MEIMQVLRKRWALTTTFLILTIIATATAVVKLPWTYTSAANVLFVPSQNLARAYGGNPYLAFSTTINELADAISYETTDPVAAQALATAGYTQGYTITNALNTSAPILLITVTGSSAGAVEHTLTGVVDEVSTLLARQQSDYRPADRVHDTVIASDPRATRVTSKKARPLIAVLGAGLVFTVAVPILVDAVAERARRRWDPDHPTMTLG